MFYFEAEGSVFLLGGVEGEMDPGNSALFYNLWSRRVSIDF